MGHGIEGQLEGAIRQSFIMNISTYHLQPGFNKGPIRGVAEVGLSSVSLLMVYFTARVGVL